MGHRQDASGRPAPPRPVDRATMRLRNVLFGGGVFDVSGERPNQKGWQIFELGQRSFWPVATAIDWDEPIVEDPAWAGHIAAMLAFLCPGEKAAVTGATIISGGVESEEAKFYFAEQALEEAKHYEAMRRVIPLLTGRPMEPPGFWVRMLYSFGVVDPGDVAFTMGSINIIGEHLAHQILHRLNHVATAPELKRLLAFIGRDESRHIAAGQRFFPEVYHQFKRRRHEILARNMATTLLLLMAGRGLVNPMNALGLDLTEILDEMYRHYEEVTGSLPPFPEQAMRDAIVVHLRKASPTVIKAVAALTTEDGRMEPRKLVEACRRAARSPRALREMFAA